MTEVEKLEKKIRTYKWVLMTIHKKNEALIEYVKKNLPEETELLRMLEEK